VALAGISVAKKSKTAGGSAGKQSKTDQRLEGLISSNAELQEWKATVDLKIAALEEKITLLQNSQGNAGSSISDSMNGVWDVVKAKSIELSLFCNQTIEYIMTNAKEVQRNGFPKLKENAADLQTRVVSMCKHYKTIGIKLYEKALEKLPEREKVEAVVAPILKIALEKGTLLEETLEKEFPKLKELDNNMKQMLRYSVAGLLIVSFLLILRCMCVRCLCRSSAKVVAKEQPAAKEDKRTTTQKTTRTHHHRNKRKKGRN